MSEPTNDPKNEPKNEPAKEPAKEPQAAKPAESAAETAPTTMGRTWWLLPALTFLVGLVLGGVVIGALRSGDTSTTAPPTPSASSAVPDSSASTTTAPAVATVVVPAECLQVADDSRGLVDLTQQAAAAVRDLDAAKLSDLVRQIDTAQTTLRQHADACRAVEASIDTGATPSETTLTPGATTTPSTPLTSATTG